MELMPLKRVVTQLSHEADPDDQEKIRKAIRAWHNRLHNGSIPRNLVTRLGRELYVKLEAWETWITERDAQISPIKKVGRPRTR